MNRPHGLFTSEDWRDTVIQLYSFSKSYAIPGHRTGALTADAGLIEQIAKILDCIQICAPRTAQARAALGHRRPARAGARPTAPRSTAARRYSGKLSRRCRNGGSSRSAPISPICGIRSRESSAQQVAEKLATERGVLCLPGSYFGPGQEGHLRVAFANVGADVLSGLTERFRGLTL